MAHVEINSPLPFHGTVLSWFPFSFPGCSSYHVSWVHFLQFVASILGFFGFHFQVLFPMGCHGEILSASLSFHVMTPRWESSGRTSLLSYRSKCPAAGKPCLRGCPTDRKARRPKLKSPLIWKYVLPFRSFLLWTGSVTLPVL